MLHVNYDISKHWSVASGIDYTTSGDSVVSGYYQCYGPGASALGVTVTPTYTNHGWFIRNELSYVRLQNFTLGHGFGSNGLAPDQIRDIIESGFWF
ncbi:outer membrane beta-barrel protein [Acidithiobacillus ferrianus]|uniref:Outer membrane beta-barrel protein n=1 Tax=Acidithiobacillus ferrianus TaxID=2678518 RepID=A0A845U5B7_9PROT|nr:outer membrane beta-barrel protein [Acidithiobacillus ferrianus]